MPAMDPVEKCATCGVTFKVRRAEWDRRIRDGATRFFCCLSHAAIAANASRKAKVIDKICPVCKSTFSTKANKHESTFCSRSCASKGSVTDLRRAGARRGGSKTTTTDAVRMIRALEMRKYAALQEYLDIKGVEYIFEFCLEKYIYDLLIKPNILIEFDSYYHLEKTVKQKDTLKETFALERGFKIYRVRTAAKKVIPVNALAELLTSF